jgi:uncharacterized glyoxalase superfamily protein PhnB
MQSITPCLWFDHPAEEAARFYVSVFKNSQILEVSHYGEKAPNRAKSQRGTQALHQRKKLDIETLQQAYQQ